MLLAFCLLMMEGCSKDANPVAGTKWWFPNSVSSDPGYMELKFLDNERMSAARVTVEGVYKHQIYYGTYTAKGNSVKMNLVIPVADYYGIGYDFKSGTIDGDIMRVRYTYYNTDFECEDVYTRQK